MTLATCDFVSVWEGTGSRSKIRILTRAEFDAHPLCNDPDFREGARPLDWFEFLSMLHCESLGRPSLDCLCRMVNASPDGIAFPDEWRSLASDYAERRESRGMETIRQIHGIRPRTYLYPVHVGRLYFAVIYPDPADWPCSIDRIEYRWVNKKQAIKLGLDDPDGLHRGAK